MTEKMRARVAQFFRRLLDRGVHRKEALRATKKEFKTSRASIYRYCAAAGISTA